MLYPDPTRSLGYDVKNFYKQKGCSQQIARSPLLLGLKTKQREAAFAELLTSMGLRFEHITMLVIGVYAIWMAIDTDLNPSELWTNRFG